MGLSHSFSSRRSAVMSNRGMVCTSQPLAAQAGISMLMRGGNAIDATIATAAALSVVEPMSTGLGGDAFALVYLSDTNELKAIPSFWPFKTQQLQFQASGGNHDKKSPEDADVKPPRVCPLSLEVYLFKAG